MSMKNILKEWRQFINEGSINPVGATISAQGIVVAKLNDVSEVLSLQQKIKKGEEFSYIPEEKLHITMLHQNVGKQLKKDGVAFGNLSGSKIRGEIQTYDFGTFVDITFEDKMYVADADGKRSVFIKCDKGTNDRLAAHIKQRFVENYNSRNPDATISEAQFEKARNEIEKGPRHFHISLANNGVPDEQGFAKTGDSVALVHVATVTEYTPGKDDEV